MQREPTEITTGERTPRAKALIRKAKDATYDLLDDPTRCIKLFYDEVLPKVPEECRAEALRDFRALMHDEQTRVSFVLWLYMSTLERFEAGDLD